MQMFRGADGQLYRVTDQGCVAVRETPIQVSKTAFSADEAPSVDDDGAARMYISG